MNNIARRQFLQYLGAGAALSVGGLDAACALLQPVDDGNPLARKVSREWEKIYHDQYRYDSSFDWVCSPNDTHACRIRAYVRNGVVVRSGATYDYQKYADLYGNHASINWNPRQCAKGYTFHRVIYGPYRLRHPIIRRGWKAWAFPLVVIGMNSIAAYCLAHLIDGFIRSSFRTHLGSGAFGVFGPAFAPLAQGGAVLLVFWLILYWMLRRKIFLRI